MADETWLETPEALDDVFRAFEAGTLAKEAWTHATHVTIGACYAFQYPDVEALARLRTGIQFLNTCQGVANTDTSGYHETLTRFWLLAIRDFLERTHAMGRLHDRLDITRALVQEFGANRGLFKGYYSFDVVASVEARRTWVAPDCMPFGDRDSLRARLVSPLSV